MKPLARRQNIRRLFVVLAVVIMIIITCFTRVNPSAKAVINGCPAQLKITNNKYKKNYNNNNNPKNWLQNTW